VAWNAFDVTLPFMALGFTIACIAFVNGVTWLRLHRNWPVTDQELFFQLVLDVLGLDVLVYLSGGATNPFISLLLLPLILTATLLPPRYSWSMAVLTVISYTLLLFWYIPFAGEAHDMATMAGEHNAEPQSFRLHVMGMWFNFVVSAGLIAIVAVRMQESIRNRDHLLAMAREETLRNERIIALGTMAAGAAHELGTPLSTIAVINKELQREYCDDRRMVDNLTTMRTQIDACKHILSDLLASSIATRPNSGSTLPLDTHIQRILEKWSLVRPQIQVQTRFLGEQPAPNVIMDQTLDQSLMNLFNNAADASPDDVEVECTWTKQQTYITIRDRGPGLSEEALRNVGKAVFTTKSPNSGIGIGLFLSNATIERFGGEVRWFNREGGGTITQVTLPLNNLTQD
jgi:two-component system sensor histidine kinase RegB